MLTDLMGKFRGVQAGDLLRASHLSRSQNLTIQTAIQSGVALRFPPHSTTLTLSPKSSSHPVLRQSDKFWSAPAERSGDGALDQVVIAPDARSPGWSQAKCVPPVGTSCQSAFFFAAFFLGKAASPDGASVVPGAGAAAPGPSARSKPLVTFSSSNLFTSASARVSV